MCKKKIKLIRMYNVSKTTLQPVAEISETENATAVSRSRNGIMLWELPTPLSSTREGTD